MAQFSDDRWYRAEVIDIAYGAGKNGGDLMAVRYVDYGSFEYLDSTR
jgi:Tudor domain